MGSKANTWAGMAAGAVGGLVGAFAMNQFHELWSSVSHKVEGHQGSHQQQPNSQDEDATEKTARAISEYVLDHEPTKPERQKAASAVHYGIGTMMGAVYGVSAETLPISRACRGVLYGGAVWLFADEIAVPAFGLSSSPAKTPLSIHASALASHFVYGFVTDSVRRMLLGGRTG